MKSHEALPEIGRRYGDRCPCATLRRCRCAGGEETVRSLGAPATSQTPDDVLEFQDLKDEFQELQGAYGLVGDKAILELFLSPQGATWTLVITDVSGKSCILAAGDSWEQKPDIAGVDT